MNQALHQAIEAAIGYLLSRQATDGHWQDYRLPVGVSDAWVTGYVGAALTEAAANDAARHSCLRAADWLYRERPYPAGWGYNGRTGPDADSTAFALHLLAGAGIDITPQDRDWLRQCWLPGGGFATYHRPDAWGEAHGDVTPVAYLALTPSEQKELRPALLEFLARCRQADGTWPSYWWRTCHYATYWSLRLLREIGQTAEDCNGQIVRDDETHGVHSVFDLALVTGIAELKSVPKKVQQQLLGLLLEHQQTDGAWPGGANLRVTEADCHDPWVHPRGKLYSDTNHLITTATALRVLCNASMMRSQ